MKKIIILLMLVIACGLYGDWIEQRPAGDADKSWILCDIDSSGTKFIAGIHYGRLYTYDGSSWTEQQPAGDVNKDWVSCGISSDGTKFIATEGSGRLYTYDGSDWTEQQPAGAADKNGRC